MSLTTKDLTAIKGVVTDAVDTLAGMVHEGFEEATKDREAIRATMATKDDLAGLRTEMNTRFTKIENQLRSVENYKVTQLQLIRILRRHDVITAEDAQELGISA